jgi:hypothetical protein
VWEAEAAPAARHGSATVAINNLTRVDAVGLIIVPPCPEPAPRHSRRLLVTFPRFKEHYDNLLKVNLLYLPITLQAINPLDEQVWRIQGAF